MAMSSSYKPSPLSYGSPRSSPFRRPESPASPSPLRNSTPTPSPTKSNGYSHHRENSNSSLSGLGSAPAPAVTPSRLGRETSPSLDSSDGHTPRGFAPLNLGSSPTMTTKHTSSPGSKFGPKLSQVQTSKAPTTSFGDGNALSKLQPAQVRELREGFQTLDRDSDGLVGKDDVVEMLTQLGLPSGPSDVAPYFPPGSPQTLALPAFLTSISTTLSNLSHPNELMSAFSAFDEDDSGQISMNDLRDALLHTAPEPGETAMSEREVDRILGEFGGRRAFGRNHNGLGKRGEVFNYHEFMSAVVGNGKGDKEQEE